MKSSIKKNNEIKANFLKKMANLTYFIKKTNLNPNLNEDEREDVIDRLTNLYEDLDTALGTGNEDVSSVYKNANDALKQFEQAMYYGLKNEIKQSLAALSFTIDMWVSTLEGDIASTEEEKQNHARRKLNRKLDELNDLIAGFAKASMRIENDVKVIEKSIEELDEQILNEDNERRLNDLYRQVTTVKSKLDTLNVRKSSYNACYNLLDLIRANVKEIVEASNYSSIDLNKAKAFLNISKLKVVLSEPDKALNILKMMNKELEAIMNKVKAIDSRIMSLNGDSISINEDALRYKEELMAKKRAKESLKELDKEKSTNTNKVEGDNYNEVL